MLKTESCIQNRKQLFKIVKIFHNFCCIFDQINAGLVSRRNFFKNNMKNHTAQKRLSGGVHS